MNIPATSSAHSAGQERIPSAQETGAQRAFLDAILFGNFDRTAAILKSASPRVLRLLSPSCPPAVSRLVVPVHVNSVDGEIGRVSVGMCPDPKGGELRPLLAELDSTRTVVWPADRSRIGASGLHAGPNAEETSRAFAVGLRQLSTNLDAEATAGSRLPLAKAIAGNDSLCTARAHTSPSHVPLDRTFARDDGQSPEHRSLKVDHGAASHAMSLPSNKEGWA